MDEKTQHLKSDVVASLRKLADDVEAGALLEANLEIHNELKIRNFDPGMLSGIEPAPDLHQHRNARISLRWADQMPEEMDAAAGLTITGAGLGLSDETLEKLRQWPGDKGEPAAESVQIFERRERTRDLASVLRRSAAAAIAPTPTLRDVMHNALVAIAMWLEAEASVQ